MPDVNQMYAQKTEMANKKFGINKDDQKSTVSSILEHTSADSKKYKTKFYNR